MTMLTAKPVPIQWHENLSIFASESFLKSVGDDCGWLGGFNEAGILRCILPYIIVRKFILRMVRFRVETIALNGDLTIAEEKSFLSSAMDHFRSNGVDLVVPASTNTIFHTYPDGAVSAPYGSYIVDLTQPEETLWENLHSKHRNSIRSASKKGVTIQVGMEHLDAAYKMMESTLKRSGLSFARRKELDRLLTGLGEQVKLCVATHQDVMQGCALIPFSRQCAYYLYGGSARGIVSGAMNLLHWEAMRLFKNLNVSRYDFYGVRIAPEKDSKQEGLRMFKERFGGRLEQGYMWKYALRPFKYYLYCLAARLRSRGDIVDHERHKLANCSVPAAS